MSFLVGLRHGGLARHISRGLDNEEQVGGYIVLLGIRDQHLEQGYFY